MQLTKIAFALVLASCALAQEGTKPAKSDRQTPARSSSHFPIPRSSLSLGAADAPEGGQTLASMMLEFCRVSGQNLSLSEPTRQMLQGSSTGLVQPVEVPPSEVYSFVEGVLYDHGIVVTELRATEPRLLGLVLAQSNDGGRARDRSVLVPAERVAEYAEHPALMIRTVLDVAPLDARQIANCLRATQRDQGTQLMLPIGSASSLLLEGPGAWVASTASVLSQAVAIERDWLEKHPPPADVTAPAPTEKR